MILTWSFLSLAFLKSSIRLAMPAKNLVQQHAERQKKVGLEHNKDWEWEAIPNLASKV